MTEMQATWRTMSELHRCAAHFCVLNTIPNAHAPAKRYTTQDFPVECRPCFAVPAMLAKVRRPAPCPSPLRSTPCPRFPQAATAAKVLLPAAVGAAAVAAPSVSADGDVLHAAQYPWSHNGIFSAYDASR